MKKLFMAMVVVTVAMASGCHCCQKRSACATCGSAGDPLLAPAPEWDSGVPEAESTFGPN